MRIRPNVGWFLAYTAAFAVLAGFVFWGTWSLDAAPVMPDCPTTHNPKWIAAWFAEWLRTGKWAPDDIRIFLASPYFWQELQYAFGLWCSGLGLAYFCRGRGFSLPACYGGGLLLAFCGYWTTLFSAGHLGWFEWMTYGVFAFGLADRAVRKGKLKNWLLLGACLSWASLNQPDIWLFFTLFTAAYFIWRTAFVAAGTPPDGRRAFWRRWLVGSLAALASMLATGAAGFRSAYVNDFAGRSEQLERGDTLSKASKADEKNARWIFVTNWSMPPEDTLEFVRERANGDTSCPISLALAAQQKKDLKPYTGRLGRPIDAPSGNYRQHSLYVGPVTCLLALVGVILALAGRFRRTSGAEAARSRSLALDAAFFFAAAVLFYLFSLGRFCEPLYRHTVYAVPFLDSMRAPVKWHHLTELCLAFLAACGIEAILRTGFAKARKAVLWCVMAIVLAGAVDLAHADSRFCVPVTVKSARRLGLHADITYIQRQQFSSPQVAAMVKHGYIVPLAAGGDIVISEVLKRHDPVKLPPVDPVVLTLGILSVVASLGVLAFAAASALKHGAKKR